MLYNAKEHTLNLQSMQMDYLTFGKGSKPLIMIQGLNTRSIKGAADSLAFMYRIFAKDYKVYLFDRRKDIKKDKVVSGKASEEIAEKLGCEIYIYDELGHAAYEEAKDFNKRVYEFFKR